MATDKSAPVSTGSSNQKIDWLSVVPKSVDNEDALGDVERNKVWERMYKYIGMSSSGEDEKRMARAAIYVYCLKNGTSREGEYSGNIVMANGRIFSASIIPRAASKLKIRKFMRSNMNESYTFFKETRCMESDERFVAKVSAFGIAPENGFATADWMDDCPYFTPAETKAHNVSFARGIDRARRARGGKSLEDVESGRVDDIMDVQGPNHENGHVVNF